MKLTRLIFVLSMCVGLAACQTTPDTRGLPGYISKDVAKKVHIGKPYTIKGKTYYPSYDPDYDETGIASWYGPGFHGKKTANGEVYDQYAMTAAHPTLPIPSLVRVTNLENHQTMIVRINDRGPFAEGRIIDLSRKAAETIGIKGIEKVRVTYLKKETEAHWASMNYTSKKIPALEKHYESDESYNDDYVDNSIEAESAPIMSVGSMQIASLDAPAGSNTIVTNDMPTSNPLDEPSDPNPTGAQYTISSQRDVIDQKGPVHLGRKDIQPTSDPPDPTTSGYFIQAGAFASEGNAQRLVDKLEHIGQAFSERLERPGGTLHRVRVGPYSSRADASNQLHQFFKLGIKDAAIVAVK